MPAAALAIPFPAHSMDPPAMNAPQKPTGLPDHERGRGEFDLRELDKINARLTRNAYVSTSQSTAAEKREADLKRREELEFKPVRNAEAKAVRDGLAETEALAESRGETVSDDAGMRRILDRDPLLSLARGGHLTPDQLETGQTVRNLYDSRAADAGAMDYEATRGGAHNNDRFVKQRLDKAKASEMLGRIERAVAIHCSAEPACLVMLRAICERGATITSQGTGRAYARNCKAIARALDVAEAVLARRL